MQTSDDWATLEQTRLGSFIFLFYSTNNHLLKIRKVSEGDKIDLRGCSFAKNEVFYSGKITKIMTPHRGLCLFENKSLVLAFHYFVRGGKKKYHTMKYSSNFASIKGCSGMFHEYLLLAHWKFFFVFFQEFCVTYFVNLQIVEVYQKLLNKIAAIMNILLELWSSHFM